jgi:hypothetical protein
LIFDEVKMAPVYLRLLAWQRLKADGGFLSPYFSVGL